VVAFLPEVGDVGADRLKDPQAEPRHLAFASSSGPGSRACPRPICSPGWVISRPQAAIHAVPDHPQTRWDGWYDDGAPLAWLADRGLRDAAREAASGPLVEEKVLVHGDYQHFNVYVSRDPVTGRQRRMRRTVKTQAKAAQELATLLRAAEAGRALDDSATLGLALDRYLEVTDLAVSTRTTHESYVRRIIRPVLGDVKLRKIGPDSLDALHVVRVPERPA
jgi:hypothetical protein